MFVRSHRLDLIISSLFVLAMGACGNFGGCGACGAAQPLPPGGLPATQTVEGGAQIRVTPAGFTKLTSILPGVLNNQLANGFCMPQGQVGSLGFLGTGVQYCGTQQGQCNPGCKVNAQLNPGGLNIAVTNPQTMNVQLSTSVSTTVHLHGKVVGVGFTCDLGVSSSDLNGDLDIAFGINAATGELDIHVAQINAFHLNMDFSGCGPLSSIGNFVSTFLDSFVGQFIIQLLTPAVDNLVQGFLPHPLGVAGMLDVGKMLGKVSPGTKAEMEARMVPGGYVDLVGNGMSLGVIMGINSDIDPTTRTGTRADGIPFASEPARCVPAMPVPSFGTAPYNLPTTSRSTFALNVANEFNGMPDPGADLAMGVSQTTLDQFGHHAVTSGAMCLGVGTSLFKQLNVGTIGILVPSLADLQSDKGNDPLLLVTRPQRPLTFRIGDNTAQSPALTIGIDHMEVDFYAFLYERYVRAFTLDLTMNVGVNLAFDQQPGMPAKITPSLVGISSQNVTVKVLNSDFVKETPAHLQMVLPSVFDLITPLLGNLPAIQVPTFAGFSLHNLQIQRVMTGQDEFLALYAQLGAGLAMRSLAQQDRFAAAAVDKLDAELAPAQPHSTGTARLVGVDTPSAERIRGALLAQPDGKLPSITFDVDRSDALGRPLEWTWRFNDGMWHEYSQHSPLVISDAAFAWQGKFTIGLKSRVVGDYTTVSEIIDTPVVIDSVGPKIFVDKGAWHGDAYAVPVFDTVSETNVTVAFGRPSDTAPATGWFAGSDASQTRWVLGELAEGGRVRVFAKDELGNTTSALIAPFHGQAGSSGCACETGSAPGAGSLALFGLVGLGLFARRRHRGAALAWLVRGAKHRAITTLALWAGATVALSLAPGCSCNKNNAQSCETAKDCGPCPAHQLPFCIDHMCLCSDDIPAGRIGPYSKVAVAPDGTVWVSAYAQSYGDLVVAQAAGGRIPTEAWEWVDGVPSGPVVVPGSKIRGGISDNGPDVGMYTSLAITADGTPIVAYFDRDTASLKVAARWGGTWTSAAVDVGTGPMGAIHAGMYTSLSIRGDNGHAGVAYLAHVTDGAGEHAEVRYAEAKTTQPMGPADWDHYVVDTAPVPVADPAHPNVYPLPEGLGLFITSARDPRDHSPVVAYYDRTAGELKVAKWNSTANQFGVPVVLDGGSGVDDGWNPSIQIDAQGVVHAAYVDATSDQLRYLTEGKPSEIVDDGYRIVGMSVDGYPKPEFHQVADAGLVLPGGVGPLVVYQDATTQELLLAQRQVNGMWTHISVAGATSPWPGAYGFFASAALQPNNVVLSTWVIDQPTGDNWVEVFSKPTLIQ